MDGYRSDTNYKYIVFQSGERGYLLCRIQCDYYVLRFVDGQKLWRKLPTAADDIYRTGLGYVGLTDENLALYDWESDDLINLIPRADRKHGIAHANYRWPHLDLIFEEDIVLQTSALRYDRKMNELHRLSNGDFLASLPEDATVQLIKGNQVVGLLSRRGKE